MAAQKGHPSRFGGQMPPPSGEVNMGGGFGGGELNPIKSVFRQANAMFTPDNNKR